MNVIIVGGGIAGLTSSIALVKAGHHVVIYEKSQMLHEAGAALHIHPNAARILHRWGFSPARTRVTKGRVTNIAFGDTLEILEQFDLNGIKSCLEKYGAELYYVHRADLHAELMLLAQNCGVEIRKGSIIEEINPSQCTVQCSDQSMHSADLIIGADGIHSIAVRAVLGRQATIKPGTTYQNFRLLIPTEDFEDIWETSSHIWERSEVEGAFWVFIDRKSASRLVWFPCRDNKIQYIGFYTPIPDEKGDSTDYTANADLQTLQELATNFHPVLQDMLRKAHEIKSWRISAREPLPYWHQGQLLLVGDAAHAMLPYQGQGAAQAIEDAVTLEVLFSDFNPEKMDGETKKAAIKKRLEVFEKARRRHATAIQLLSDNPGLKKEALQSLLKDWIEDEVPLNYPDQAHWKFTYDAAAVARETLGREIPG
ncbi:hypothetical protein K3495_g10492 [Podosphaera aphanis]|nr:hypothetical protein K3495_g10492 [Podosphaera aphanis]